MDADTRLMNSSMLVGPCLEQQVLSSLKHLTNLGLIAVLKLFGSRYAAFVCLFGSMTGKILFIMYFIRPELYSWMETR